MVAAVLAGGLALPPVAPPAAAQDGTDPRARYETCLIAAQRAPAETFERARDWEVAGGGNLARHCWAMALFWQGDHAGAATALGDLARETEAFEPPLAAEFHDAAARSWLEAGAPLRAADAAEAAVRLAPEVVAHRVTRAVVAAEDRDWTTALDQLSRALERAPDRPDLLVLRAAAHRQLGQFARALDDVDAVLAARPADAEALLERGLIRNLQGDTAAARADWRRAADLAPGTETGRAAALNLQRTAR
jgi:tetratricopeptide (TPR) repeat protein